MTLDNTTDPTNESSTTLGTPKAAKAPRRRVTRTAAAPGAVAANEPAAEPAPEVPAPNATEAAPKKTSRRATRPTTSAAPTAAAPTTEQAPAKQAPAKQTAAEPSTSRGRGRGKTAAQKRAEASAESTIPTLDVLSELGLRTTGGTPDASTAAEPEAAPRAARSGRTRARKTADPVVEAPAVAPAEPETAAPQADVPVTTEAPTTGRRRATRKSAPSTDGSTDSAPETPTAVDVPEEAPKRRTRKGAKAADTDATTETSAAAPATEVAAEKAPRSRGSRGRKSAAALDDIELPNAADAAVPLTAPVTETAPVEASAPATRSRRATRKTATESPATVEEAPASDAKASDVADTAAAPTTGRGTPRLATTALLFQAPDPAAGARRSRRAQSPAGPPKPAESAPDFARGPAKITDLDEIELPNKPVTRKNGDSSRDSGRESGRESGNRRGQGRDRSRGKAAAPEVADAATELDTTTELDADELAAIEEVEAIEAELIAEGVEIPAEELEADDLDELADEDEGSADENDEHGAPRRRRRRGGRGRRSRGGSDNARGDSDEDIDDEPTRAAEQDTQVADDNDDAVDGEEDEDEGSSSSRRRRRRRRGGRSEGADDRPVTVPSSSRTRTRERNPNDEVTALKGSTRLEAKRQRRREGRDAGRRRSIITEAEFLARRESVERAMIVREKNGRTQIAVLEDGVLVEHYVSQQSQASMAGNVYLGRVQNVLPSMEAAFIDVGKGRNAVLYAGEVNWDAAGLDGQPRRIEQALKSGDSVLVQVTKDPIGHKGARLTSQVTLAGRYLVYVPGGGMTGISRKLPDTERARLKKILKEVVPDGAGVIVRTAAEGASEDELRGDVARLQTQWEAIEKKAKSASAPALLQGEPDLAIRVVRDIFNDDFSSLVVSGANAWNEISSYVEELAPDLRERVSLWNSEKDAFSAHRVDEQLAKGMDRKVWLPSGGSLVIDRTEAMTVVDVNTGKFTGSGGTLEETVTRNNIEAAEEIVRQLRLRDIGGIIVIDFIDMVLESNRDLVLRRLVECLGRDRTKHQVAEVTSLGLVQMTRKRVGQGLVEAFSETCDHCNGRGFIVHTDPIEKSGGSGSGSGAQQAAPAVTAEEPAADSEGSRSRSRRKRSATKEAGAPASAAPVAVLPEVSSEAREAVKATLATIAAAAVHAHEHEHEHDHDHEGEHAADDHDEQDQNVEQDQTPQDEAQEVVVEGRFPDA